MTESTSTPGPPAGAFGDGPAPLLLDAVVRAAREAHEAHDVVDAALRLAQRLGDELPLPAMGRTWELWSSLASLATVDLTVTRVIEPHLDALAILHQAAADGHHPAPAGSTDTWGVFAAEGPGTRLTAEQLADGWILDGVKPWCSVADRLDRALITAWVDDRQRGLFSIDLHDPGVRVDRASQWVAHGLPDVTSVGIQLDRVRAIPVGPPGWYLDREGFAWGGIGVGSIWFGGALGLAERVRAVRRTPDQIAQLHIGQLDVSLWACEQSLRAAADQVDSGRAPSPAVLANRARSVCAATAEDVMRVADHALGPGPLTTEADYVQRVSDLRLYVRQHHAERDLAALGRLLITEDQR